MVKGIVKNSIREVLASDFRKNLGSLFSMEGDYMSEDIYRKLRTPAPQVLSGLNLGMLLFSCIPFFLGKDFRDTPNYLVVSSIVEIIIILLGFIPIFLKKKPDNYPTFLKHLKISTGVSICAYYNTSFVIYNLFFIIGELNGYKLFDYWIIGITFMLISYIANVSSILLLFRHPDCYKGKTRSDRNNQKFIWIISTQIISWCVYIQKIIEFLTIPNAEDNNFIINVTNFCILISNAVMIIIFWEYVNAKLDYEKAYNIQIDYD
ncbi:DUF5079 family protein [Staphylococcus debuckii]|uniref:DUF5079 family protein n=1 Tax=Staphylococcus debuckii TaxID=2044912 RepID=UPI000F435F74|nr:DUF5079 family protein [Staphylococcus debuckii]AYU53983.1 DUF5079 family protein [Staphylococcus debuckii]